ncbi:MAG: acetate--CoA ligase family protein, partial [Burkholderiales bacterium]|nr:acetate--CoA ligase family protein [Burkholderiales bacterium]
RNCSRVMLRAVAAHAPDVQPDGVLVSEMVAVRSELIAGLTVDPQFGPAFLVGLGGGDVERLRDVAMGLLPLDRGDCARLLGELADPRIRLLGGSEREALVAALDRVAAMAHDLAGALVELDVNPLALAADGRVLALDAVMDFAPATRPRT